ncbi:MAG: DUF4255 domain-containing protein [Bacteroidota bacterium]
MIDKAIKFLRDQLNDHLTTVIPLGTPDRVVISNVVQQEEGSGNPSSLTDLKDDSILLSLIHLEEERVFKDQRKTALGSGGNVQYREPDIRINLYLLYSSHFTNYLTGLQNLSEVLQYYQANNVFDQTVYPGLNASIGRLIVDLHTFSLDQSFQFWQSLGGKFLPSVIYKVRLLVFQDNAISQTQPPITEVTPNLSNNI